MPESLPKGEWESRWGHRAGYETFGTLSLTHVYVAESRLSLTPVVTYHLVERLWGRQCRAATHFQLAEPREMPKIAAQSLGLGISLAQLKTECHSLFCVTFS